MFDDPLTLYKLIILYMLDRASHPLTTAQISSFFLEKDYTNFMTLQQVIGELTDTELISAQAFHNRTQLTVTKEGRETLGFFGGRINDAIKKDVQDYLSENEITLRNEISVLSDYYKSTTGEYEARLLIKERGIHLMDLTLSLPTKEMAAAVCDNWQKRSQEVYQALTGLLF